MADSLFLLCITESFQIVYHVGKFANRVYGIKFTIIAIICVGYWFIQNLLIFFPYMEFEIFVSVTIYLFP